MSKYAESTTVSPARSRADIEDTLTRYGASKFMSGWQNDMAVIAFELGGRQVRFILPLPDKNCREVTHTPEKNMLRSKEQQVKVYDQLIRQRWRALYIVIKAKLEAVESGITCFEDEFLAHIVLPNNQTVGQFMLPQIENAYANGIMPAILPMITDGRE